MISFFAGCETTSQKRLNEAAKVKVRTKIVTRTIVRSKADRAAIRRTAAKALKQPPECKKTVRLMWMAGDDLEALRRKADQTAGKANSRIVACYERNERNRKNFLKKLEKS